MIDTLIFGKKLKELEYNFFSGVPCSYQTNLINFALNYCDFIMSANEGDAIATCSGAYLAGKKPVVLMQNSGLGNAVSPLTSLNHTFDIPILGFISHRGQSGIKDEPQHELMGKITTELLDLMEIKWEYLSQETTTAINQLSKADKIISNGNSFFFIISKNTFSEHLLIENSQKSNHLISRNDALTEILKFKDKDTVFLGTTGKTGREMFEIEDLDNNFYMVGSMGCISSLSLGISLNSKKKIVVIDGDGSLLMRMGNLGTIGYYHPPRFLHILLDNRSHDSTGGQFTVSKKMNFIEIAENCGYKDSKLVESLDDLKNIISNWIKNPSLTFLHFNISEGSKKNLGRPSVQPRDVSKRFKKFINE